MDTTIIGALTAAGFAAAGAVACFSENGEGLLRPPGAAGEADFRARCIEACPYRAIRACKDASGAVAGTPSIDARAQACRLYIREINHMYI